MTGFGSEYLLQWCSNKAIKSSNRSLSIDPWYARLSLAHAQATSEGKIALQRVVAEGGDSFTLSGLMEASGRIGAVSFAILLFLEFRRVLHLDCAGCPVREGTVDLFPWATLFLHLDYLPILFWRPWDAFPLDPRCCWLHTFLPLVSRKRQQLLWKSETVHDSRPDRPQCKVSLDGHLFALLRTARRGGCCSSTRTVDGMRVVFFHIVVRRVLRPPDPFPGVPSAASPGASGVARIRIIFVFRIIGASATDFLSHCIFWVTK